MIRRCYYQRDRPLPPPQPESLLLYTHDTNVNNGLLHSSEFRVRWDNFSRSAAPWLEKEK
jgi:hypothetical protein